MERNSEGDSDMPLKGLPGRVVIVTGAAEGIGRATVRRLLDEGAKVALVDRNEGVAQVADEFGEDAFAIVADVSSESEVDRYMAEAVAHFGRVDALYNNAAINATADVEMGAIADSAIDVFDRLMAVNVRGTFLGMRAMLRQLAVQGQPGIILNTSSELATRGAARQAIYAASKAAIVSLTKTAALEAGPTGTRVNAIAPGPTETALMLGVGEETLQRHIRPVIPLGRLARPEEIAALAAWLLSDESEFVSSGIFHADGGAGAR